MSPKFVLNYEEIPLKGNLIALGLNKNYQSYMIKLFDRNGRYLRGTYVKKEIFDITFSVDGYRLIASFKNQINIRNLSDLNNIYLEHVIDLGRGNGEKLAITKNGILAVSYKEDNGYTIKFRDLEHFEPLNLTPIGGYAVVAAGNRVFFGSFEEIGVLDFSNKKKVRGYKIKTKALCKQVSKELGHCEYRDSVIPADSNEEILVLRGDDGVILLDIDKKKPVAFIPTENLVSDAAISYNGILAFIIDKRMKREVIGYVSTQKYEVDLYVFDVQNPSSPEKLTMLEDIPNIKHIRISYDGRLLFIMRPYRSKNKCIEIRNIFGKPRAISYICPLFKYTPEAFNIYPSNIFIKPRRVKAVLELNDSKSPKSIKNQDMLLRLSREFRDKPVTTLKTAAELGVLDKLIEILKEDRLIIEDKEGYIVIPKAEKIEGEIIEETIPSERLEGSLLPYFDFLLGSFEKALDRAYANVEGIEETIRLYAKLLGEDVANEIKRKLANSLMIAIKKLVKKINGTLENS